MLTAIRETSDEEGSLQHVSGRLYDVSDDDYACLTLWLENHGFTEIGHEPDDGREKEDLFAPTYSLHREENGQVALRISVYTEESRSSIAEFLQSYAEYAIVNDS